MLYLLYLNEFSYQHYRGGINPENPESTPELIMYRYLGLLKNLEKTAKETGRKSNLALLAEFLVAAQEHKRDDRWKGDTGR